MSPEKIREYDVVDGPFNGTYGQVYVVCHGTLGMTRAIKRLHPYVKTETIRDEAIKQQAVKSPYVVQVFDFFEDPPAILMEFCPVGLDTLLKDRLRQTNGSLPFEEAREILQQVLQGLNDAHKADVIHGDIKPANVRIGEDRLAKLGDFGAARRLRQDSPVLRGSSNWMAPETLDGGEATKDSDYFSFGVLAYLVFSGRHPYFANDPSCLTSEDDNIRSLTFRVPPLSDLRRDIPQKVADLVMELLSRDAKVRARAEQELKAALSEKFEPEAASAVGIPRLFKLLAPEEKATLIETYNDAKNLFFAAFRPREAVQLLDTFLKDFRWERFKGSGLVGLADCWSLRAFINNSSGFFKEAVEAATNGLIVHNEHVNSLHARGYAYIQLGRYTEAENDLKKALYLTADPKKRDQIGKLLETLKVRQQQVS